MCTSDITIKLYPTSGNCIYNVPYVTKSLPIIILDDYANADRYISNIGEYGRVLGVYKEKPRDIKGFAHAKLLVSFDNVHVPSIEFKMVVIKKNPRRRKEVLARLKILRDTIRPYRNVVYDAVVRALTPRCTYIIDVRSLLHREYDEGTVIEYESQTAILPSHDAFAAVCKFVAGVHRRCALLGMIQAAEADTNGVPRKLYERHVLRIVKEFL